MTEQQTMNTEEIIVKLRMMARYPTVTLPRDTEALKRAAELLQEQFDLPEPTQGFSMTQDEIIMCADASGLSLYGMGKDREKFIHYLIDFAKLVARYERENVPPQPVIDESAAKRIATTLGWEPKRKWKILSSPTINSLAVRNLWNTDGGKAFARAIEQRLKVKNNG